MMLVIELWFCSSLATAATTTATTSTTTAPEIFSSINFGLLQLIISVSFGLHTSFHPLSISLLPIALSIYFAFFLLVCSSVDGPSAITKHVLACVYGQWKAIFLFFTLAQFHRPLLFLRLLVY